jgi:hypothetical protein
MKEYCVIIVELKHELGILVISLMRQPYLRWQENIINLHLPAIADI